MDHAKTALDKLDDAEMQYGEARPHDSALILAAIGIGHALLDVADAIREQTDKIMNDGVVTR